MAVTDARDPVAGAGDAVAVDEYRALLHAAEKLLDGVDGALASLDDGSYGACEVCGTPVDDHDLEDDPLARRCTRHLEPQGD